MSPFVAIIRRDISLSFRAGGGSMNGVAFFSLSSIIFAIAIGPNLSMLRSLAAPIIWTSALLATISSLDRIFLSDFEDGSLEILAEATDTFALTTLAKSIAHWISCLLPLIVATPVIGIILGLPMSSFGPLITSLLVGSPALSLIGASAAAITLSLKRASVLMAILTAPLYIPTVIFGVAAASTTELNPEGVNVAMLFLAAISLISLAVCPLSAAAAIKLNME